MPAFSPAAAGGADAAGPGGAHTLPAPRNIMQGPGKSKPAKVRNKVAAAVQITAEQLLREAKDRQELEAPVPRQKLHDKEELIEYRIGKRKYFEDLLRKNKNIVGTWTKYAAWEEKQGEYERARSIFERCITNNPRNHSLWMRYGEMEMKAGNINMARNMWERCTTLMPRVDQFWIKWVLMEQTAGDFAMCRQVFDKWFQWKPQAKAWKMRVKFELKYNEVDLGREVVKRMVVLMNDADAWLYYAKFEERHGKAAHCRRVWEEALEALGEQAEERVWIGFAKFEERQKEFERARTIYKLALDRATREKRDELFENLQQFEKQFGGRESIEDATLAARRVAYEESLRERPDLVDTWINYARMEEAAAATTKGAEACRDVYERAIAAVPKVREKQYWARYIYLWIMYAFFEEVDMESVENARKVWQLCIQHIPHSQFSFSKVWIFYAQFELRHAGIEACRKVLGHAVGKHPRPKLFNFYIELEHELGEISRVRKLYENWLKSQPVSGAVWGRFAEFEARLGENDRATAIFELGVGQRVLDQPEMLWKKYIQHATTACNDVPRARSLYRRLAEQTRHVKVYMAWAIFEAGTVRDVAAARAVYEEADGELSQDPDAADEWRLLLSSWRSFEEQHGSAEQLAAVDGKLNPQRTKKRHSKLLAKAQAWAKRQRQDDRGGGGAPAAGAGDLPDLPETF